MIKFYCEFSLSTQFDSKTGGGKVNETGKMMYVFQFTRIDKYMYNINTYKTDLCRKKIHLKLKFKFCGGKKNYFPLYRLDIKSATCKLIDE